MDTLISILLKRISGQSIRSFASEYGLNTETLRLWISGKRQINIDGLRLLARAFPNDAELHQALRAYWIGLLEDAIATSSKRRKSGTVTAK